MKGAHLASLLLSSLVLSKLVQPGVGFEVEDDDDFDMDGEDYFDGDFDESEVEKSSGPADFGNIVPGQVSVFVEFCSS